MNHQFLTRVVIALGLAMLSPAATLFSALPNQSGGSDLNAFLEADAFTISSGATITGFKFWAAAVSPADYAGSIDWVLYSNGSGAPGGTLASGNATPSLVSTGGTVLGGLNEYSLSFPVNIALGSAGTYWLSLHNGPTGTQPPTSFYWEWASDTGNSVNWDLNAPGVWVSNFAALAFEVTGDAAVPEPGSIVLLGSGLIAAWLGRRRISG